MLIFQDNIRHSFVHLERVEIVVGVLLVVVVVLVTVVVVVVVVTIVVGEL